jgi:hypothetical protein
MTYEYTEIIPHTTDSDPTPTPTPTPTTTPTPVPNPVVTWLQDNIIVVVSILFMILIFLMMRPIRFPGDIVTKWIKRASAMAQGIPPQIDEFVDKKIAEKVAEQLAALKPPSA